MDAAFCRKQRCTQSSGMARPKSRQGRTNASVLRTRTVIRSSADPCRAVEHFAGSEHRMHCDGQLCAIATAARLKPTRSLNASPHVRRVLSAELRVRITVAASYSRLRT